MFKFFSNLSETGNTWHNFYSLHRFKKKQQKQNFFKLRNWISRVSRKQKASASSALQTSKEMWLLVQILGLVRLKAPFASDLVSLIVWVDKMC